MCSSSNICKTCFGNTLNLSMNILSQSYTSSCRIIELFCNLNTDPSKNTATMCLTMDADNRRRKMPVRLNFKIDILDCNNVIWKNESESCDIASRFRFDKTIEHKPFRQVGRTALFSKKRTNLAFRDLRKSICLMRVSI